MSKYRKALDRQKENIKKLRNNIFIEYKEDFDLLQEAVEKANKYNDKETPKKVNDLKKDKQFDTYSGYCSNCSTKINNSVLEVYCYACGQKLDWSKEI